MALSKPAIIAISVTGAIVAVVAIFVLLFVFVWRPESEPEPEPSWPSTLTIESIVSETQDKDGYSSYIGTYKQADISAIQLPDDDTVPVVQAWTRDYELTGDTVYLITLRSDGTLTMGYWRDTSVLTSMISTITVSNLFESGVIIPVKRNGYDYMYDVTFTG